MSVVNSISKLSVKFHPTRYSPIIRGSRINGNRSNREGEGKLDGVTTGLFLNKFIIASDQSVSVYGERFCLVNYQDTVISRDDNWFLSVIGPVVLDTRLNLLCNPYLTIFLSWFSRVYIFHDFPRFVRNIGNIE